MVLRAGSVGECGRTEIGGADAGVQAVTEAAAAENLDARVDRVLVLHALRLHLHAEHVQRVAACGGAHAGDRAEHHALWQRDRPGRHAVALSQHAALLVPLANRVAGAAGSGCKRARCRARLARGADASEMA